MSTKSIGNKISSLVSEMGKIADVSNKSKDLFSVCARLERVRSKISKLELNKSDSLSERDIEKLKTQFNRIHQELAGKIPDLRFCNFFSMPVK